MAVEPDQRARTDALEALADAATAAARTERPDQALSALAQAATRATGADAAVVRVLDRARDELVARGVAGAAAAAAQLEGSRVPRRYALEARAAEWLRAEDSLVLPVEHAGELIGTLEVIALSGPMDDEAAAAARAIAAHVALVLRLADAEAARMPRSATPHALELAGEALAAGSDTGHVEAHLLRLALSLAEADGALLWRCGTELSVAVAAGVADGSDEAQLRAAAARALERGATAVEQIGDQHAVALRLGEPPLGVLQLLFRPDAAPVPRELDRLAAFAVRAAQALRAAERVRSTEEELEQTRALLAALAQASEQLSLAHAVETTIERVRELVGAERLAVYLREEGRLVAAAARGLAGPHARVAEALLQLALGPFRARGMVVVADAGEEPRLRGVADAVGELGIEAAVALPLVVGDEAIGLLAAYPKRRRLPDARDEALLAALAGQLAVAVQNARLHDRATRLGVELEHALSSEREAARRLRALYEISGSFAQSMSLDVTVSAVARTVVEQLEVDAAMIRLPDARREALVPHAVHIADEQLAPALRTILFRPQSLSHPALQRIFSEAKPMLADAESTPLLAPFLDQGSTAAVIPIATSTEVIATLTIVSLNPERPITPTTLDVAETVAAQAALAIDNARLYQQQKDFADAMQRSLLPQVRPAVTGLDVGEVYAPSARVELGGDLYDYVALDDGRFAVVLGDVTGHGIDAAADMAMAKYVFRALVRDHSRPSEFVRAANRVVVDEIAPGKFITLLYLVIDPATGEVACASAGHPPPRLVDAKGNVRPLSAHGLALGVDHDQAYEEVHAQLEPGGAVVLYTDGVIEARRNSEQYGLERLDALLSRKRHFGAEDIAASVIESARRFTGGDLTDDCAVVVVKRI
jgi:serine phosphatase RsbU (regulator of sigma subunit)